MLLSKSNVSQICALRISFSLRQRRVLRLYSDYLIKELLIVASAGWRTILCVLSLQEWTSHFHLVTKFKLAKEQSSLMLLRDKNENLVTCLLDLPAVTLLVVTLVISPKALLCSPRPTDFRATFFPAILRPTWPHRIHQKSPYRRWRSPYLTALMSLFCITD